MNEITLLPEEKTQLLFVKSEVTDEIIGKIEEEVKNFVPDLSTASSRKEIASFAYKIAQTKSKLDDIGKSLTEQEKKKIKLIDDERKRLRDRLDELKTEARRPLTEWEQAEEEKARKLQELKDSVINCKPTLDDTIDALKNKYLFLKDFDFSQFPNNGEYEKSIAIANMEALKSRKLQIEESEKQKAELAKIKAEQESKAEAERKAKAEQEAKQAEINRSRSIIEKIKNITPRDKSILLVAQIQELEFWEVNVIDELIDELKLALSNKLDQLKQELERVKSIEEREAKLKAEENARLEKERIAKIEADAKAKAEQEAEEKRKREELAEQARINSQKHREDVEQKLISELQPFMKCSNSIRSLIDAINQGKISTLTIKY